MHWICAYLCICMCTRIPGENFEHVPKYKWITSTKLPEVSRTNAYNLKSVGTFAVFAILQVIRQLCLMVIFRIFLQQICSYGGPLAKQCSFLISNHLPSSLYLKPEYYNLTLVKDLCCFHSCLANIDNL